MDREYPTHSEPDTPGTSGVVVPFQTHASGGYTNADVKREGSTLLAMLYAKARAEGLQTQELAQRLDVPPAYLGQLRSRDAHVEHISREFAQACAKFLGMPLIFVMVAAGQLREQDFRGPVDESVLVRQALNTVLLDPAYGPLLPPSLLEQDEPIQRAFVILYERASGKRLLGGRVTAAELITFAKEKVPKPFEDQRQS